MKQGSSAFFLMLFALQASWVAGATPQLKPAQYGDGDYKWGYINDADQFVIPPRFLVAHDFSEDLASVSYGLPKSDGSNNNAHSFCFIDKNGKEVIGGPFTFAGNFSEGLAHVENKGSIFYIGKSGQKIIGGSFAQAGDFYEGLAWVQTMQGKCGYINHAGEMVIEAKYDITRNFSEGLAAVASKYKRGFIDKKGTLVIPQRFGFVTNFSEGIALAAQKVSHHLDFHVFGLIKLTYKKWVGINSKGIIQFKIPRDLYQAEEFKNGIAPVMLETSKDHLSDAYVDAKGNLTLKDK